MSTIYVYTHICNTCMYMYCSEKFLYLLLKSSHSFYTYPYIHVYSHNNYYWASIYFFNFFWSSLFGIPCSRYIKLLTCTKCTSALLQRCHMDLKHPLPSHSHSYSSGSLLTPTVPEYEGIMHPSALHFTTHFSQFILVSVPTYIWIADRNT